MINLFNWVDKLVGYFTLNMGGGSSGSQTSTTYTSNIPEYAKPFYEQLLKSTGKNIFETTPEVRDPRTGKIISGGEVTGVKQYQPYGGERIAGFTPGQQQVQEEIAGLQTPGGFATAQQNLGAGQGLASMAGGIGLARALGYNPNSIYAERTGIPTFSSDAANYYMDPYQQAVTDIALRETRKQGDIEAQKQMLGAMGRGTFGGARNTLAQAEQKRNLAQNLADVQARGSAAGFQNAQQQFNADMARMLQSQQANQQAGLTAQQLTQQGQTAAAQLAGQTGISGLQASIDAAKAQAAASAAEQTANLERLKTQATTEQEKQALDQKILDLKYQTEMEARDWEKKQLEFYSNILRGTGSGALGSTQVQYGAPQSPYAGIGLGLQGLSLAKALG